MKRVFTIAASLIILQNPVSILNVLGMATALSGVALYNKVWNPIVALPRIIIRHSVEPIIIHVLYKGG